MQISVSIEPYLSAKKSILKKYIEEIIHTSRKMLHFGNEISLHFDYFKYNPAVFSLVQSYTSEIDIDLHLMSEPVSSVDGFRSVSYDAEDLKQNKSRMIGPSKLGLVLDLGYKVNEYTNLIKDVQVIILMTVKCGKSGQQFQASVLPLVSEIRQINPDATIIVDGGVNESNIDMLKKAGIDIVVVGTYAKKCYENGIFVQGINRLLQD